MSPEDLYGYMTLPRLEDILRGIDESIVEWQKEITAGDISRNEEAIFHINKCKHLLEGLCNFVCFEFIGQDEEFRQIAEKHGVEINLLKD